jgi:hypothetical protein
VNDSDFARRYGPWALVTGASSGIGAALARQIAARGVSVVLCARRRDRLEALASEIGRSGREALVVEADLAAHDFLPALIEGIGDRELGLVVNNAGFGMKGPFLESDLDENLRMLDTNCRAPLMIAHAFGRRLAARGRGGMIFTSSTAAFQGLPGSAHYAATKGWDLQLAEGLWYELRGANVDVLALCPGPTDTEGPRRTGVDPSKVPVAMMSAESVAAAGLDALGKRPVAIPGVTNRLGVSLTKVVPRRLATVIAGRLMKRVTHRALRSDRHLRRPVRPSRDALSLRGHLPVSRLRLRRHHDHRWWGRRRGGRGRRRVERRWLGRKQLGVALSRHRAEVRRRVHEHGHLHLRRLARRRLSPALLLQRLDVPGSDDGHHLPAARTGRLPRDVTHQRRLVRRPVGPRDHVRLPGRHRLHLRRLRRWPRMSAVEPQVVALRRRPRRTVPRVASQRRLRLLTAERNDVHLRLRMRRRRSGDSVHRRGVAMDLPPLPRLMAFADTDDVLASFARNPRRTPPAAPRRSAGLRQGA